MEIMDEKGRWNGSVGNHLSARFDGNRQQRKKHARLRERSGASIRSQSIAISRAVRDEQKAATMMRRLKKHLGLLEEQQVWGRGFKIRSIKTPQGRSEAKPKKVMAGGSRSMPAYRKPLVDKRGRIALFMAISYVGFRSAKWRAGLAADHVHYILREDAIEIAAIGAGIISSMGVSTGEIAQAWQALEEVEKAYRANAIVQHRIVVNLPDALSPAGRERVLTTFCEKSFGRYGLPYVAIPHVPDPSGNRRNFHGHVCVSARPMERTGDHEWTIGEEKISGFTDPDSLKRIRAEFAAVLNRECRREGLEARFTHQSYKERGIDAKRQEHCGPERTALHRKGEAVDMVVRNQIRVKRNDTKATLAVVQIASQAATKFEELMRWRLALLARRKMLRRRAKIIDGVLTFLDDATVASGFSSQYPSASQENIAVKRNIITNVAQLFDRVDAGKGINDRRRDSARRAVRKGSTLAKIEELFAPLVSKASSGFSALRQQCASLARRGEKYRAIRAGLRSIEGRQAIITGWRAHVAAITSSGSLLFREIKSIPQENLSRSSEAVGLPDITDASTNLGRANQAGHHDPINASSLMENVPPTRSAVSSQNRSGNTASDVSKTVQLNADQPIGRAPATDLQTSKVSDYAEALPEKDCHVAPSRPLGGTIANSGAGLTADTSKERTVLPGLAVESIDKGLGGSDGRIKLPATSPALDPITAIKLLWAYGDLDENARNSLGEGVNELYASAAEHPQAAPFREALLRGRANHRLVRDDTKIEEAGTRFKPAGMSADQPIVGPIIGSGGPGDPGSVGNTPTVKKPSLTGTSAATRVCDEIRLPIGTEDGRSSNDEPLDAMAGCGETAFTRVERLTVEEMRELLKPRQLGSDGVSHMVDQAGHKQPGEIASEPTEAMPPIITDDRSGALEETTPAGGNRKQPSEAQTTPSPLSASTTRPADEHDQLIAKFETARSDDDRRISAAAIRKDSIAFARMSMRLNPQWIKIDDEFRTQQQNAAAKERGKGK